MAEGGEVMGGWGWGVVGGVLVGGMLGVGVRAGGGGVVVGCREGHLFGVIGLKGKRRKRVGVDVLRGGGGMAGRALLRVGVEENGIDAVWCGQIEHKRAPRARWSAQFILLGLGRLFGSSSHGRRLSKATYYVRRYSRQHASDAPRKLINGA